MAIAPLSFLLFSSLLAIPSVAQIGVQAPPTMMKESIRCSNLELQKSIPCPDSTLFFHEGSALIEKAFNEKDFAQLDKLYAEWCTGAARFPDGRWKLPFFSSALSKTFKISDMWRTHLDDIKAWQKASPTSSAPLLAESVYWHAYAWKARGNGYAASVSKEAWQIFGERLLKSKASVEQALQLDASCPALYSQMLDILTDGGASEEQLRKVFSEGVHKSPEYHQMYFAMARHYEPRWGGSPKKYDQFAFEASKLTKNFEGMGMYARLYWLVDYENGIPFRQQSRQAPAWQDLRKGYEDLMRRYPSSLHNLGKFVGVACMSPDSEFYRKLRSKIQGYEQIAQMTDSIDACDRRHNWGDSATKRQ